MILLEDTAKKNLYEGLLKHFPEIPSCIVLRTVELASTPGVAFDALYDFKLKLLPVRWNFNEERWHKTKLEIF
jgi:hypothetical protein